MKNAFDIVRDFENAVADYTGANYCVAVNSCTNALFLALMYHKLRLGRRWTKTIHIPKKTYVSVPMQIIHSGHKVKFRDAEWDGYLDWKGLYRLEPLPIWDSARRFTSRMCLDLYDNDDSIKDYHVCVSFHWTKILGIQQGGAILTNDRKAYEWYKRARFDGRTEGVAPKDDKFDMVGWHMYMSPEVAAEGLVRLMHLKRDNPDLPNDDYPDLSKLEIFK